ncbi:MAG TPA: hypothetical protein VEP68_05495 [Anaeromyxobacteraceae bacterium]|nr:hypothetical protein [Anaeromyxobacteraceae bacterium]
MLAAAALAALTLAATPQLEGSVAAGAGYDANLNHEPAHSLAAGGGYAAAGGAVGASLFLGDTTNLYGGLRLDGEIYPMYSDLSTGSVGLEAALLQEISGSVALVLAPTVGWSWSGDPARDATLLAARLTLRVRPVEALALRAFYGHTHRDASDPAFSYDRDALGASAEWRAARRTYLSLGYVFEIGQEVFYRDVAGGGGGMGGMGGMGHGMSTFGRPQEAYSAEARSHSIPVALEVGLGGDLYLEARYAWRLVQSSAGDYQDQSAYAGLGWRY